MMDTSIGNVFSKSQWIWSRKNSGVNEYSDFIHEFSCNDLSKTALNISSDSNYVVWLNSKLVNFGQYHDLPENKVYDTLDITDFIKIGHNKLCILGYSINEGTQSYIKGAPSIIFEVVSNNNILAVSGEATLSRLSRDYFSGRMYKFSGQLGFAAKYFANRYDNWQFIKSAGFSQSVVINRECDFSPRPISKLDFSQEKATKLITQGSFVYKKNELNVAYAMQHSYLSQCELSFISDYDYKVTLPLENNLGMDFDGSRVDCIKQDAESGIYLIFDLQEESAGLLKLEILAEKGTKIDICYGEQLDDMRVRAMISDRCFAFEVVAGSGLTKFISYTKRIGCRYIQLFVHSAKFTLYKCGLVSTDYPLQIMKYDGLDFLQTKIYETSLQTLRLCMHEHYEDCPWREQALYTFDSRNQILCGYYAFDELKMPRASLLLMGRSLREDGHLELCSPCRMPLTIPMFSLAFILSSYEYIHQTNDIEFYNEIMPICEKILQTFLKNMRDGGLMAFAEPQYWNMYEWREGLDGMPLDRKYTLETRYDAVLNAFMIIALDRFNLLREKYEYSATIIEIDKKISQIKDFCNTHFWNEERQLYCSYYLSKNDMIFSEFVNYILLYAKVSDEKRTNIVINNLIAGGEDIIESTLSPLMYKYQVLLEFNQKKYLPYVLADIEKIWGNMLFKGATTFWETQLGADDFYFAGSLCHGWSAIPVYVYQKYILKNDKNI